MDWGIVFSPEVLNFYRRPPSALVIDNRASLNLKIKHKKTEQQFICHNPGVQQHVAVIHAPPCKPFTPSGVSRVWQAWQVPWAQLSGGRKNCLAQ